MSRTPRRIHIPVARRAVMLLLLFIMACGTQARPLPRSSQEPFRVIAYVRWNTPDITEYPLDQLSHLIYSFVHLDGAHLRIGTARDSASIRGLVALKQQHPHLRILLALGGWGGCETCSEVFADHAARQTFAGSVLHALQHFGADGIDLDWEYPAIEGHPGHRFADEDRQSFTALVRTLRTVLGPRYEISFAAGGFTEYLLRSVEWTEVVPLVDNINLMSYDLVNGYSVVTGHHTGLYPTPHQQESAHHAIRMLDSLGVPAQKIIIGAAFYARVWENVDSTNNGLFRSGTFKSYVPYRGLASFLESGRFRTHWDSVAHAPFAYDLSRGLFATYDDGRSVRLKTHYALDRGLGGIMFWELTGDLPTGGLLGEIARARAESPIRRPIAPPIPQH